MKQLSQYIQEKLHISKYQDLNQQEKEIKELIDKWIEDTKDVDFEWHLELIEALLKDKTFEMHIFGDLLKYEKDKNSMNFILQQFKEYMDKVKEQGKQFS